MAIDKNDPEVKALIEAAVEAAIEPLERKKDELLGEVKKLRKNSTIDPDEHQKLADKVTELEAKLTESGKMLKTAEKKAEQVEKALQSEATANQKLLRDKGLVEALTEAKAHPDYLDGAMAILTPLVTIKTEGDQRIAMLGEKPLKEGVLEWIQTEKGKRYATAAQNTGSGAQGSGTAAAGAKTMNRAAFDAMIPGEQMAFIKAGGKPIDS